MYNTHNMLGNGFHLTWALSSLEIGQIRDVPQSPESDPVEAVGLHIRKVSVCCMFIASRDQYINLIVIWVRF